MLRPTLWLMLTVTLAALFAGFWLMRENQPESLPRNEPVQPRNPSVTPDETPVEPNWGRLSGRFQFSGTPPNPVPLQMDGLFCDKFPLVDETLLVNPTNRGIANVRVRLLPAEDQTLPIHTSYQATATARVRLALDGCRFLPRITVLRTSQTLLVSNFDLVAHSVHLDFFTNDPIVRLIPPNQSFEIQCREAERLPIGVFCRIHPWMRSSLVICDHPYVAVTDADGRFEIENLPVGEWTFRLEHELAGYINRGERDGKPVSWPKGRVTMTIRSGENQFGDVVIPASSFKR